MSGFLHFFSIFQAKQFWELQLLAMMDGMYVDNCTYDICKKIVILARFESTLLETKYIACKIFNMRSLNIIICEFRGPTKTHSSGMSETAVVGAASSSVAAKRGLTWKLSSLCASSTTLLSPWNDLGRAQPCVGHASRCSRQQESERWELRESMGRIWNGSGDHQNREKMREVRSMLAE